MFRTALPVALLAASLFMLGACSKDPKSTLSAPDAYAMMQADKLTLIDIRRPDEWRDTGVAKGALHIDMANTQGESGFVQHVSTAIQGDQHAPIGLIGLAGNRSGNAQRTLQNAGFTQVYNIKEGMMGSNAGPGWIARGLPVEPCKDC